MPLKSFALLYFQSSGLITKPEITGFKWIYSNILSNIYGSFISNRLLCCCQNYESELLRFFFLALSIIQIIHSFLLSDTWFLIAAFNSKEICFFISRTISSNMFLLPLLHDWLSLSDRLPLPFLSLSVQYLFLSQTFNHPLLKLLKHFRTIWLMLFAPSRLPGLLRYYSIIRHPYKLRYSASWIFSTCTFLLPSNKDFPCSVQKPE